MRNKTIRSLGATTILIGVAVAAVVQRGSGEPASIEIVTPTVSIPAEPSLNASPVVTEVTDTIDYRIGLLAAPTTDNYWTFAGTDPTVWNAYVLGPTKPALYGIDPATNALTPELGATEPASPTWDADGWRVRVALSGALAWSDGTPMTAKDVVYTFDTVRRLGLGGGWEESYPAAIEEIVAVSDSELRIEFASRPSLQLWPYGLGLAPIMPAHVWAPLTGDIDSADALYTLSGASDVSGGPLQIVSTGPDRIVATGNPGHPESIDGGVTYHVFPGETEAVAALENGDIDSILNPNGLSSDSVTALGVDPDVTIQQSPANSVRYLGFNLGREPMSSPGFRHALALLLDRKSVTESVVPGASAAYTLISPANRSWFDTGQAGEIAAEYEADLVARLDEALVALADGGYAWTTPPRVEGSALVPGTGLTIDGRVPAPLTIVTPGDEYDPARPDYTQRIEATLEAVGFDVRPVVTDFDTVIDLAFTQNENGSRQYDMYVLGWTLGNPALPNYYRWFFSADGAFNSTGYEDPEFEATLRRYETAPSAEIAKDALWDMERILADDLPYLVLYHPEITEAYRRSEIGFEFGAVLGGIQGRLGGVGDLIPPTG